MHIDVSIGSTSADFPEIANVLVDRAGFSHQSVALWNVALDGSDFPASSGLAPIELEPSRNSVDVAHELILRAGQHASEMDAESVLTYAYATGSQGAILFGAHMVAIWRDEQWWTLTEDPTTVSVEQVASILGVPDSMLIGLSDSAEALEDWGLEEWYANAGVDLATWVQDYPNMMADPDSIVALPAANAILPVFLAYAWGAPTQGPPSPDPTSAYHRTRLTALKLAKDGFLVTVDWGPFTQTYEWAMENPDEPRGEVFIDTMSAEYESDAWGHLPNVAINADTAETFEMAMAQAMAMGADGRLFP